MWIIHSFNCESKKQGGQILSFRVQKIWSSCQYKIFRISAESDVSIKEDKSLQTRERERELEKREIQLCVAIGLSGGPISCPNLSQNLKGTDRILRSPNEFGDLRTESTVSYLLGGEGCPGEQ